jgi:hypothetical protein
LAELKIDIPNLQTDIQVRKLNVPAADDIMAKNGVAITANAVGMALGCNVDDVDSQSSRDVGLRPQR